MKTDAEMRLERILSCAKAAGLADKYYWSCQVDKNGFVSAIFETAARSAELYINDGKTTCVMQDDSQYKEFETVIDHMVMVNILKFLDGNKF